MSDWNDQQPIYRQLRNRVVDRILAGTFAEGKPIPSVRQVSAEEHINPITVSRAYQLLVDEGLLEKRRGLGMFVIDGAVKAARSAEREQFLKEEWPLVAKRIKQLQLNATDLLEQLNAINSGAANKNEGDVTNPGDSE
jgi:GntR family transcriptional regulator